MPADNDSPTLYTIEFAEIAEIEIDRAYFWLSSQVGAEKASQWVKDLQSAVESLRESPRRFAAIESRPGARRMLVGRFHVLYRVIEPAEDEEMGIVRILNVFHAASMRSA